VLDITIVNVALPAIGKDLHVSADTVQWVISAYAVVFAGFLLLGGRAADLVGRRRIFMAGLGLFGLASLACAVAPSAEALIAARAVQGLGAAMTSPAALAVLTRTFREGRERNVALSVWGSVGAFAAAAGVLLGGFFVDLLSWEWIFFANVPVGAAALLLAPFVLVDSRSRHMTRFDVTGALLARTRLTAPEPYAITADLLAWGAGRAAEHGVHGVGALDAVAAFGLDELAAGAAEAGIVEEP
jgi:MFS family permease